MTLGRLRCHFSVILGSLRCRSFAIFVGLRGGEILSDRLASIFRIAGKTAEENGIADMTLDKINAEIAEVRKLKNQTACKSLD